MTKRICSTWYQQIVIVYIIQPRVHLVCRQPPPIALSVDPKLSDPTVQHIFAQVSTNLHYPAVVLDHSSSIKSVQCQGQDLLIMFSSKSAYDFSIASWASVSSFVLVTYTDGCGISTEQRTFWLIDHLSHGACDTCIIASAQKELAVEDAMHGVDMVWGTYDPRSPPDPSKRARQIQPLDTSSNVTALAKRQNNSGCGEPSSPRIDGLPTAACGSPTFDQDLDDAIGYLDFSDANFNASIRNFAPGLENYTVTGDSPLRLRRDSRPMRRDIFSSINAVGRSRYSACGDWHRS